MTVHEHEGGEAKGLSPPFRLESPSQAGKSTRFAVLKLRPLFKAASAGPRFTTDSFTMQKRLPAEGETLSATRFGFTVTKKIGNAVVRNRIRRRLREAVAAAAPDLPKSATDLVLVAREAALSLPFSQLVADVVRAAKALATRDRPSRPRSPSAR